MQDFPMHNDEDLDKNINKSNINISLTPQERIVFESYAREHNSSLNIVQVRNLKQDASDRVYKRIIVNKDTLYVNNTETIILMNAQRDPTTLAKFLHTSKILAQLGVRVPRVYICRNDIAVIEDVGDVHLLDYLDQHKNTEIDIYKHVIDMLHSIFINVHKQDQNYATEKHYDVETFLRELNIFKHFLQYEGVKNYDFDSFVGTMRDLLSELQVKKTTLVLRDAHAQNIMIKRNSKTYQSDNYIRDNMFFIDHQDAIRGSVVYDPVSLLDDARRDVDEKIRDDVMEYCANKFQVDTNEFKHDYHILGLQRNLRILGVFAKQKLVHNNDHYLKLIPRVTKYVKRNLDNLSITNQVLLAKVREIVSSSITPSHATHS